MKAAETKKDGIGAEEGKVRHASAAHNDQTHHAQQNPNEPVVASPIVALHRSLSPEAKVEAMKEKTNQFQAAPSRDSLIGEGDRKILNSSANLALRYPHNSGPRCCDEVW